MFSNAKFYLTRPRHSFEHFKFFLFLISNFIEKKIKKKTFELPRVKRI